MIIGIGGHAGSGKDTVGTILAMFIAGKTKEEINYEYDDFYRHPLIKIKKFALPVKAIAAYILGESVTTLEDREFKESTIDWLGITVRELLQKIGTECFRDNIDEDFWIKMMFKDSNVVNIPVHDLKTLDDLYSHSSCNKCGLPYLGYKRQYVCAECAKDLKEVWIITDVRFPNEAKAIRAKGGEIILIKRGESQSTHPSETLVEQLEPDFVILNNGTIPELIDQVEKLYENYFSNIL